MLQDTIKRNPAFWLLVLVYLWILPSCLSYQNAWVEPEELRIKSYILTTGTGVDINDFKNGLNWRVFEYKPRATRPLSSYFEIIDTKFRCWLWRFIRPNPGLSLTWIFSLIFAPLFLYLLLKNLACSPNVAVAMTAFYLATPGVLSYETMLFRPAKPMTNFFIILCLYLASVLKKDFLDKDKKVPYPKFLIFWGLCACSFYWDETALLIFPAVLFIFPAIFRRKLYLSFWFLLPLITLTAYLKLIPYLCVRAGQGGPDLFKYLKYDFPQSIDDPQTLHHSINYIWSNAVNLVTETMGLFSVSSTAPKHIPFAMALAAFSWMVVVFYIAKIKKGIDPLFIFLIFLLFVFNTLMSTTMMVWGPYYYGSFWSVFFVLFLSRLVEKAQMPKMTLCICLFFIIISTANGFIGTNTIYKKYHWYPYSPETIEDYFKGTRLFYDRRDKPVFSGEEIKTFIDQYWTRVKKGTERETFFLPRELGWLPVELEPSKHYDRSIPGALFKSSFQTAFPNGDEIFDWLLQKRCMVKYPPANYFIKEDLGTTITDGLREKFPFQWKEITAFLQQAQSKKPYFYMYVLPGKARDYNDRGNDFFNKGKFTQAIAAYNKAVAIKPDYEDAYYNLGLAYYKQGDLSQAVSNYDRAIEINPEDFQAYNDRAVIYYQLKKYDEAWADVHRMEELGHNAINGVTVKVNPQLISALSQRTGGGH